MVNAIAYILYEEQEIRRLIKEWDDETGMHSFDIHIRKHPNADKIISLGKDALPTLFKILQEDNGSFHVIRIALHKITGVVFGKETAPKALVFEDGFMKMDIPEMKRWWIEYGKEKGYLK